MKNILIVIPARYQSSRFPGKPFALIAGKEMLLRVANIADYVCRKKTTKTLICTYIVATDSVEIEKRCNQWDIPVVMTSETCSNGTERCWDSLLKLNIQPELIINLQGDNPLCPPPFIEGLIDAWATDNTNIAGVFTPYLHLSWDDLSELTEAKKTAPFSGTTVTTDNQGFAMCFSKTIIPSIRKPEKLKEQEKYKFLSPIKRHIGLYAYTFNALQQFVNLPKGEYEQDAVEGLEQLRFLENSIKIKMVSVSAQRFAISSSGVDQPEDVARAEEKIKQFGEYDLR